MQPNVLSQMLDDVLKRTTLAYASLPDELYLNSELCVFLQQLEQVAHQANEDDGTMTDDETEAGTLLGFTSAYGVLQGLDISLHEGSAFDPKAFTGGQDFDRSKLPMGFSYQGTVHTHPRRAPQDPLRSFSGIDMITVMLRSYQERVSIMVSGNEVHLILCCHDAQVRLPGRESTRIVVRSLEDLTAGTDGVLRITEEEIVELSHGPQSVGAIAASATRLQLGYYTGPIGGALVRRR